MLMDEDVDQIDNAIRAAGKSIAHAITPLDAMPFPTEDGGQIGSLTEAAIGISKSLMEVALALDRLATAQEMRD